MQLQMLIVIMNGLCERGRRNDKYQAQRAHLVTCGFYGIVDPHIHNVVESPLMGRGWNCISTVLSKEKGGTEALEDKIAGSLRYLPNTENAYPWRYALGLWFPNVPFN